jgi:predicted nucleic acid-binding protein
MNGAKAFFDTNVLLYMYGGDGAKRTRAKELFREYSRVGRMLLSTQVVQEFYAAGSRKLGMPRRELREATAALLDCPLIVVGPSQITSAIQNEERYQISFWDALILAAAESGEAQILYTEDLNDGQQYGSVLVRNPFQSPGASSSGQ